MVSRTQSARIPPRCGRTSASSFTFSELKAFGRRVTITKRRRMERRNATWKAFERKCKIDRRLRRRRRGSIAFSDDGTYRGTVVYVVYAPTTQHMTEKLGVAKWALGSG